MTLKEVPLLCLFIQLSIYLSIHLSVHPSKHPSLSYFAGRDDLMCTQTCSFIQAYAPNPLSLLFVIIIIVVLIIIVILIIIFIIIILIIIIIIIITIFMITFTLCIVDFILIGYIFFSPALIHVFRCALDSLY